MREHPILIVDDDPAILDIVADFLDMEGYVVERAANGAEALGAAERNTPLMVLLDMRMPILDGWGFAQAIRERGIDPPIVVMTAAQDAEQWAEEVGAADYLAKPFDLLALLDAVERVSSSA